MRPIDLAGQQFGRLRVIERDGSRAGNAAWRCQCECGELIVTTSLNLRNSNTRSCGCLQRDIATAIGRASRKHGHASGKGTSEYHIWQSMKTRCSNPKAINYQYYGGRGITVCQRWLDGFENFLEDMGPRPSCDHSIDRIDNNGNYELSNCRWATGVEQNNNLRRPKQYRKRANV